MSNITKIIDDIFLENSQDKSVKQNATATDCFVDALKYSFVGDNQFSSWKDIHLLKILIQTSTIC